ncbi:MAG: CHAT domain-containing protein [Novosphingobium sp.]
MLAGRAPALAMLAGAACGPAVAQDAAQASQETAQSPEALLAASQAAERSGDLASALDRLSAAIALMRPDGMTAPALVGALARQSTLLSYAGRFDEALAASRRAHEIGLEHAPGNPDVVHRATLAYAEELVDVLRLGQAEAVLRHALQGRARDEQMAETLYELARIVFKQEQREEAAALIARAEALAITLPQPAHAELAGNIALEQARQAFENSALDLALRHLATADQRFAAAGPSARVSREIVRQARLSVLINAGRWAEAREQLEAGLEAARKLPVESRVRQNSEMVTALLRSFDPADAAAAKAAVDPVFAAMRRQMHASDRTPAERADYIARNRVNLSRYAAIALRAGDTQSAFAAAQYMAWSDVSASAASVARRLALRDPATAARLAEAERLADEAEALRTARNLASEHDSPEAEALAARLAKAEEGFRTIYAALARGGAPAARLGEPEVRTLGEAQASLAPNRALLLIIPTDNRLVSLVVRRDGTAWGEADLSIPAMKRAAAQVRLSLAPGPSRPPFDRKAALALGNAIMPPTTLAALDGIDEIELLSAGPILSVPPAVLLHGTIDDARLGRLPLGKLPYLVRRFAFSFRPAMVAPAHQAPRKGGFAGIGAPLLSGNAGSDAALRGLSAPALDIAALPPLAGAEEELRALARAFGGERQLLLTGAQATESRLKAADLGGYRTMVFATHGIMAGAYAGLAEPALVLTPQPGSGDDALLTASEIASLRIDAEWVILSACNSGAEREPGSATYSGLARAFLQAGAANLLVSLWPVRDDAASRLSIATITAHDRGLGRAAALRKAMLGMMADRRFPDGADPSLWGAFSLVER